MCEAAREAEIQLRLSLEDRGKSLLSVDSGAYAASIPKGLIEFSAAKLELKHYAVLIASAVMQRTKHYLVLRFQSPLVPSPPLQIEL